MRWETQKKMIKAAKVLAVVSLLSMCCMIGSCCLKWYKLYRDLDCVIDRAQVGANAKDMLEYLNKLKVNLKKHNATKGQTALIFTTPMTDLSLNYKAVLRIIDRLKQVEKLSIKSTAYQTALDDIRGTIRELPNPAKGILWVRCMWWTLLASIMILIGVGYVFLFVENY